MVVVILVLLVFASVECVVGSKVRQSELEMDFKIRIVEIEKILNDQSQQITDLTKTIYEQNMEINNLKQNLEKLENNVDGNKRRISNLGKLLRSRIKPADHGSRIKTTDHDNRIKPADHGSRIKPADHGSRIKPADHGSRIKPADHGNQQNQYRNEAPLNQDVKAKKNVESLIRKERLLLVNNENSHINQRIGFSAYIDHTELMGEHKVIVFNVAKTNIGNGYSTHSGVFTAPIVGLYGFSCALFPSHKSRGSLDILVNEEVQGVIFTDSDSDNWDLSSSSMTIVAMLKQGDEVFIRSRAGYTNIGTIEGSSYAKSSFAGWLIST